METTSKCEPFIPPTIDSFCLKQLKDWNRYSSRLHKQCDLNPVIFWQEEQTIKLLYAVYWVLYRDNTQLARFIVLDAFKNTNWHIQVEEKHNENMNEILKEINTFTQMDKL